MNPYFPAIFSASVTLASICIAHVLVYLRPTATPCSSKKDKTANRINSRICHKKNISQAETQRKQTVIMGFFSCEVPW